MHDQIGLLSENYDYLPLIGLPISYFDSLLTPLDVTSNDNSETIVEEPAWQNPDGAELLALALQSEQGPSKIKPESLDIKIVYGSSAVEQGLALLQMVCELLQLPFRRDVVDRMLTGMVGSRLVPSLENIGQISDALGLTAVMMQVPRSHLSRVTLPAIVETPDSLLLAAGSRKLLLRFIDPREGEVLFSISDLQELR